MVAAWAVELLGDNETATTPLAAASARITIESDKRRKPCSTGLLLGPRSRSLRSARKSDSSRRAVEPSCYCSENERQVHHRTHSGPETEPMVIRRAGTAAGPPRRSRTDP